jgi:hypothetical protein
MNRCHKHQPPVPRAVLAHISDMGEGLSIACAELALEPTPDRCDTLVHKLKASTQAVSRFRRGLIEHGQGDETT